jgi:hypothetical protein
VSSVSPSALLRIIESESPAVILDELDTLLKKSPEMTEVLRGLLNSSFKRSAARHLMSVPVPGGGYEVRQFSMWAPLLLSGIGELPDTVRDRAIRIELKRKRRDENVARLRQRDGQDLHTLAGKAVRWAGDHKGTLSDAQPEMPEWLNDRAADAWEPLFAIADLAGERWRNRAEAAARALSGEEAAEDDSTRVKLLGDLREMFYPKEKPRVDALFTKEILSNLHKRDDRPWSEWGRSTKPMTPRQLAALLKPFGVTTNQTVRRGDTTDKGYRREDFEDAFMRYLPPASPIASITQSQVRVSDALDEFSSVTTHQNVTHEIFEKANDSAGCDRVTDPDGPCSGEDDSERSDRRPEHSGDAGIPFVITTRIRG